MNPRVCTLEFGGTRVIPDRGLSSEVKESSSGGGFSNRQNLQVVRCDA